MNDFAHVKPIIVDGDVAIIMRHLRNHTSLSYVELRQLCIHQLDDDNRFEPILEFIKEKDWAVFSSESLTLTEAGASWLDQQGNELAVEQEDASSTDKPPHPYDVAKLKMENKIKRKTDIMG